MSIYHYILTLLIGFYFNEDFAGGYKVDYLIYKKIANAFILDLKNSLLFYEKFSIIVSPIFILLLTYIHKILNNDTFVRFLNLKFFINIAISFFFMSQNKIC